MARGRGRRKALTPEEQVRWRRFIRLAAYRGSSLEGLVMQLRCLECNRPIETRRQRLWHWLVCWKRTNPLQAKVRFRTPEE